jgi:glycosyltransferase involved in cell wall biosynthesis
VSARTRLIVDQLSLSEAGSDRGLGRYASALVDGARALPAVEIVDTRKYSSSGKMRHVELRSVDPDRTAWLHATTPLHLPVVKDRPWICSIQDVIPLDVRAYQKLGLKTRALFLNARRAELVVANSRYTADRVRAQLGVRAARMEILPLPVSDVFFDAATKAPDVEPTTVVVMVDHRTFDPRKRFHWVSQFAGAAERVGLQVVVVGRADPTLLADGVRYVESPSDSALAELYASALATFYPSSYEGQGLPPLEAMAAGCPVIAFSNSSISEMVSVGDFLLPDPVPWENQHFDAAMPDATVAEIESKLREWASRAPVRQEARRLARQRAEAFRRESFVESLGAIYEGAFG